MRKPKVRLTMGQEKPPPKVFLPLIPPWAQKLLHKKSPHTHIATLCQSLRTNLLMNVLHTSDVKVISSIQPVAKLDLKI